MKRSAYQAENVFGTFGPKKQERPETFPVPEQYRGYRIFRRSGDALNSGWRVPGNTTRPDRTPGGCPGSSRGYRGTSISLEVTASRGRKKDAAGGSDPAGRRILDSGLGAGGSLQRLDEMVDRYSG